MLAPLIVLWLGAAQAAPEQRALVERWAAERGTRASHSAPPSAPAYDARLVEQIELALERARAALEAAPDELARAERLLLDRPELPQAAWLLAERHALAAQASSGDRPVDDAALQRARALEGERAAAAGASLEAPGPTLTGEAIARAAPIPSDAVPLPRGRPRDLLFIDGSRGAPPELAPGVHHVRLTRGGQLVWAGWVTAGAAAEPRPLDPTTPCSGLDLAGVELGADAPRPAPGVACARWAAARPSPLGGVDVSVCSGASCAAWQRLGAPGGPSPALAEGSAWPGWLTWALVGAGAAATAGVVLWQSGALERSAPSTQFVFTGPSAAAYSF